MAVMFGALNRFIGRLDSDGYSTTNRDDAGYNAFGFQVLRNKNPELAIEPWFDFIIGINGRQIDNPDPNLFSQEVRNCAGNAVNLTLWSAKGQRTRTLMISVPASVPTLSLTLQWTPLSSTFNTWHILEISSSSPAEAAGLLPYSDYIIGTPEGLVRGESGLGELVEDHLDRELRLYVYNHEYDVSRELSIHPSRHWGGDGALGCVLGFGALHRLPAPLNEPISGPGETLFASAEAAHFSNEDNRPLTAASSASHVFVPAAATDAEFLVPADLAPPKSASPAPKRKQRAHHPVGGKDIDEYFKEGEEKSREVDFVPGAKTPPPPPPKAKKTVDD